VFGTHHGTKSGSESGNATCRQHRPFSRSFNATRKHWFAAARFMLHPSHGFPVPRGTPGDPDANP
jgi:hypothetical protein